MQFIFRFTVGGLIVSLFAALGGVLQPKSFAGLFGAAPSVAAMGSIGLAVFAFVAWKLLPTGSGAATLFEVPVAWFVVSFLIWRLRNLLF